MNPVFRAELACGRALRAYAAFLLWGVAVWGCFSLLLPDSPLDTATGMRWFVYAILVLFAPLAAASIVREMAFLARVAPLGLRRRFAGHLQWMATVSVVAGILAAAAGPVPPGPGLRDLFLQALGLTLTVLAGSIALALLWPLLEGLRWYLRILPVIILALLYCALGSLPAFFPPGWAPSLFLLPVLLFLLFSFYRFERDFEILPEGGAPASAPAGPSMPPGGNEFREALLRGPGAGDERRFARPDPVTARRTKRLTGPTLRSLGRSPAVTLLMAGYGRVPHHLFLWIVFTAVLLFGAFIPGSPLLAQFIMLGWVLPARVGDGWAHFLATPFPRRRAFVVLASPLLAAWMLWVALRLVSIHTVGEPHRYLAMSSNLGQFHLSLPCPYLYRWDTSRISGYESLGPLDLSLEPPALALWLSRYFEVTYCVKTEPAAILELSPGELGTGNEGAVRRVWLERIEAYFDGAVRRAALRRHGLDALMGFCLYLLGFLTALPPFPRSRRAQLYGFLASFLLVGIGMAIVGGFGTSWPGSVYRFLETRPWPVPGLLLLAAVLIVRHFRAWRLLTLETLGQWRRSGGGWWYARKPAAR